MSHSLDAHFEKRLAELPSEIRLRLESGLLGRTLMVDWDVSSPKKRRKIAKVWDYLYDPNPTISSREAWLERSFKELPQALRDRLKKDSLATFWEGATSYQRRMIIQQGDVGFMPEALRKRLQILNSNSESETPEPSQLIALWDPVPLSGISQMFNLDKDPEINTEKWRRRADQASRNGLAMARVWVGRGTGKSTFHPWAVANWLVDRGKITRERADRILNNNLPAHNRHHKGLILS
ncbi:MAG: hypothetical protein HN445_05985 [Bacteroidetes Order II. Incertae sedis bacterium]|nr:hypothetical protein [Bacteroidetes Order II. bacterium]